MNIRKPLIGLSIFMVLAMVVSWMVLVTLRREVGGPTNTYSAVFTDVSGMHPGDDVRVAGVRVGRVDKVELQGTVAKVTFRVNRSQQLYTDTVASVTYQNIIGQRYLGLAPGTSGQAHILPDGSTIPVERTSPSFDIAYLLNGFEPLFATLDPEQVDNITNAIVLAFQGDSGSLLSLVTQTAQLTETISGPDDALGRVITNLNGAVSDLASQADDVEHLIDQSRAILADLDTRRESLVASVGAINSTLGRLAEITDAVFPDVQELIQRQPGAIAHIVDNPDRFHFTAANMPLLMKGLARVMEYGAYGNSYPCNINVTLFAFLGRLVPGMIKLMSPGNVIRNTAVCR